MGRRRRGPKRSVRAVAMGFLLLQVPRFDDDHRSARGSCRLRLLIELPTNVPMRNPISLPPQLTFQATSLAAGGLATEIS